MESTQLFNFYRSVPQWPKTSLEFTALIEAMGNVLPAPFLAAYLSQEAEGGAKFNHRFDDTKYAEQSKLPSLVVEEFVRKQLKALPEVSGLFKQIQVSGNILGGHYLGVVAVVTREGNIQKSHGWLAVAFPKAFTAKEEILLVAIAQRLAELAEVAYLDAQLQLRSQFLSIASHELKTPLTAIYGMLQLQERSIRLKRDDAGFQDPERQLTYLRRQLRQVERLNELIDGLLDISRIQNGRFMVEPTEVDVSEIVRETISSRLEQFATESNVILHIEAPDSLMVWVDPVRMEEVVSNLVMNAIRFSPEGGVVWIRLKSDGEAFHLSVRDQGPSVPIEDRERIFKPFERAQRTARLGGLGLGLFISRQIALLHGGNVALLESVPGKGNVFEAYFPVRGAAQVSA